MLTASINQMYRLKEGIVKDVCKKVLKETAFSAQAHAVRTLLAKDAWDRGKLAESIEVDLSKLEQLSVRLWTNAPQAATIEFGAGPRGENPKPGWYPPHKALVGWAHRRLGLSGKEAESAAWAVGEAIHEHGFYPRPFMRPAAQYAELRFSYDLQQLMGETFKSPDSSVRVKRAKKEAA